MAGEPVPGGRFDFDDGGTYCGGWEDGKAHGHGVCTGPKSQGEYAGSWHFGFEVSGVYTWPSGSTFEGQWQNGKRHGLGVETRGRWTYRGEWTQGFKGRYGIRQSVSSGAKYEGTWANGLQDGYGSETYADGGTFQGQWMRGMRHGYGVRTSATFGLASHYRPKSMRGSLSSIPASEQADPASDRDRKIDDFRGGFVLKSRSDEPPARRRSLVEKSTNLKKSILQGLKIKKQRSTGDIDRRGVSSIRSSGSNLSSASSESSQSGVAHSQGGGSLHTDSNVSFVSQDELCDTAVTETYLGEWKNDRRCGFGIAERSDGLKYEGEWYNNKKYGYGVTTLRDGTREEGKYKNNVLVSSGKKKHLFMLRSTKFKERIDAAVNASARASQIALQKADIAISRTATARGKAEQADIAAMHAQEDANIARQIAKQFDPDAKMPDMMKNKYPDRMNPTPAARIPFANLSNQTLSADTPDGSRTDSPLGASRRNLSSRGMGMGTPTQQARYVEPPALPQARTPLNNPQQERYMSPTPVVQTQFPSQQSVVTMNQTPYQNQNAVHQDSRYMPQQTSYSPQQQQQTSTQQPYANQNQGYGAYPSLQQPQYPGQKMNANYLGPQQDPPVVPNRQGSFRRRPSARDPQGGYSMQQAMGDHFDHYRQEPRVRTVIKHGRRIPSPPRSGMMAPMGGGMYGQGQQYHPAPRTSYGPDATPDSGVSESMDELSPSRFGRKSHLPPMIYGDSHASSLLSFAPSEEDRRSMSPTISSMGIDSEIGSEASTGSGAFPRTASLYVNPPSRRKQEAVGGGGGADLLKRKKSMPHGPKEMSGTPQKVIPREEVAYLSSQRREELRRMQYESERLRSNPLLYLVRPDLKDWFSRQQMILLVLFINISLAIMFYKLLS
ncbi:junctophilin-3 [Trichonephila clavata]|uniref:Junctophilin-3 n=1 Tax=Trichonephila clavata TaxID=2740835 RepID=A0A8X6FXH0_TRICU|nr:junctophilin-3 [Trichonephila clavata]